MTVTKDQLTERTTVVRYSGPLPPPMFGVDLRRETYVVKDLFERRSYTKPTRVAIGPADLGVAFGVDLADLELA